jgi:hypothetical protein
MAALRCVRAFARLPSLPQVRCVSSKVRETDEGKEKETRSESVLMIYTTAQVPFPRHSYVYPVRPSEASPPAAEEMRESGSVLGVSSAEGPEPSYGRVVSGFKTFEYKQPFQVGHCLRFLPLFPSLPSSFFFSSFFALANLPSRLCFLT